MKLNRAWHFSMVAPLLSQQKNLSAIRQDPCQADACRDAETAIQALDSLLKVELEDNLHDLLWQCRLVALDLQVIASMPPLEPLSQ